jgi:hypothetical protein
MLKLENIIGGGASGTICNILWGAGRVCWNSWYNLRDIIRENHITEVLELGCGLSSELFVNEGVKVVGFDVLKNHVDFLKRMESMRSFAEFHHYEYGEIPPVEKLYPGRKWNFVFIDGPQERSREVAVAMRVCQNIIFLHDPNMGEQSFFPNAEWVPVGPDGTKLFMKNRAANHHGQVISLLKKHFGDREIIGIEIGTAEGLLTKALLLECHNIKKLYTIDPYLHVDSSCFEASFPQETHEYRRNFANNCLDEYRDRCVQLMIGSDEAIEQVPHEVDFVWIDGDHTISQVEKDIENYLKFVRPGGILGGHDYSTVLEAIKNKLPHAPETGHDQTWWIIKHGKSY